MAELAAVAGSRTDWLAEHASVCLGIAESRDGWEATIVRLQAELALEAGVDETLIPDWADVGRDRAKAAGQPPGMYQAPRPRN